MNPILQQYYHIQKNVLAPQYFIYEKNYHYFCDVKNINLFLEVYQLYRYYMNQCGFSGYTLVKNQFGDIHSSSHVLLKYHSSPFHLDTYLNIFLQPLSQRIPIMQIKEQWIEKIDAVKEIVKQYAYSYKQNIELISLIYYYTGIAENSINILNEILSINPSLTVSVGLSLKDSISTNTYDLLNPTHYMISSRMRHIVQLLKSEIIDLTLLSQLLEKQYFDIYEILYLYARILFPSSFFNDILQSDMTENKIENYFKNIKKELSFHKEVYRLLSFYVSIPKISWINGENMI